MHAMLRNKGLTRNATIPISAGLLTDTRRYFAALVSNFARSGPGGTRRFESRAAWIAVLGPAD